MVYASPVARPPTTSMLPFPSKPHPLCTASVCVFVQGLGQLLDACMVAMANSVASAALSPLAAASRCAGHAVVLQWCCAWFGGAVVPCMQLRS